MSFSRGLNSSRMLHRPAVRRANRLAGMHRSIYRQHSKMKELIEKTGKHLDEKSKTLLEVMQSSIKRMARAAVRLKQRVTGKQS
jgi:DNA anti-recombination protein RmuC